MIDPVKIAHQLEQIGPQWWGAIAGAAAAGAVIVPSHRIIAGLAAGAAVAWLALGRPMPTKAPCCASCADHSGPCEGGAPGQVDATETDDHASDNTYPQASTYTTTQHLFGTKAPPAITGPTC